MTPQPSHDFYDRIEAWLKKQDVRFVRDESLPNGFGWTKNETYIAPTAVDAYEALVRKMVECKATELAKSCTNADELAAQITKQLNKPEWLEQPNHLIWEVVEKYYL